jgi:hypothetical protein
VLDFPKWLLAGRIGSMSDSQPEPARFCYKVAKGDLVPWQSWDACKEAIRSAFRFSLSPVSLAIGLPSQTALPLCGNPKFRKFAFSLLEEVPGLPFFVLGGGSPLARELFLASLPTLQAATDGEGTISVSYPSLEAQQFLHNQFAAMLHAGISEKEALRQLTLLSRQVGMGESQWS